MDEKKLLKQLKLLKEKGEDMRLAADGWANDWQTLTAIILSARTRDETTIKVCKKLFSKYPTAKKFSRLNLKKIEKIIYPINFYRNKSKNILNCSRKILSEFGGKVPQDIEKLISLPGVGRKTANVFLAEKGKQEIGVDTHVNYISNYLGWVNSRNPKIVEQKLKEIFPRRRHKDINWILVQFGKTYTSRKEKNEILDKIKKVV
ncbi:endonuclease III [Candidatus Pacearchaeota archaeon ex4484_71]|nr:MAG: endonuclease III [Candidatus Pacearchaeota archaeon ex4484_71]